MKIKTSELIGPALDYMVHVANGNSMASCSYWLEKYEDEQRRALCEDYSTNWSQGGPIIEREDLSVGRELLDGPCTAFGKCGVRGEGPTPLIAAMRCYVASKLGDEVDIPEELT